jgi:hypothetical protein
MTDKRIGPIAIDRDGCVDRPLSSAPLICPESLTIGKLIFLNMLRAGLRCRPRCRGSSFHYKRSSIGYRDTDKTPDREALSYVKRRKLRSRSVITNSLFRAAKRRSPAVGLEDQPALENGRGTAIDLSKCQRMLARHFASTSTNVRYSHQNPLAILPAADAGDRFQKTLDQHE